MSVLWDTEPPERDDPEVPADTSWEEHREHAEREWHDRLERFADTPRLCAVCADRPGVSVYGWKCRSCFEQQQAEREGGAR